MADLLIKKHGGFREGAGRPNLSGEAAHLARPYFNKRQPFIIELTLRPGLSSFSKAHVRISFYEALKKAQKKGLELLYFEFSGKTARLLIEAGHSEKLSKIMKSLGTSFSKRMNLKLKRSSEKQGSVFMGRYKMKNPLEGADPDAKVLQSILNREFNHFHISKVRTDLPSALSLKHPRHPALKKLWSQIKARA